MLFVAALWAMTFCGQQAEDLASKKQSLKWFAPRWSFAPKLWRQLHEVVSRGAMIRIVTFSLIIGAPIWIGLKVAVPNIVMPQLWKILLILPAVVVYLIFYMALLTIIPQRIVLCRDKIIVEHSQKRVINAPSVSKIWLYVHSSNRLRLKIRFETNGRFHTRSIGIATSVDLNELTALLPCPPTVRDARDRGSGSTPSTELG